jgi:hypothetical protein
VLQGLAAACNWSNFSKLLHKIMCSKHGSKVVRFTYLLARLYRAGIRVCIATIVICEMVHLFRKSQNLGLSAIENSTSATVSLTTMLNHQSFNTASLPRSADRSTAEIWQLCMRDLTKCRPSLLIQRITINVVDITDDLKIKRWVDRSLCQTRHLEN